jgi:hypothetical protein
VLTRLSGDLAISIAGPNATQADVEAVRLAYGLNRPLYRAQALDQAMASGRQLKPAR